MTKYFSSLSPSERKLSIAVVLLVAVSFVLIVAFRCLDVLDTMDATIESQEEALLQFTQQAALVEPVERAFESMAAQHSSQWTQEEIHDRLRVEITRLSLRQVPAENAPLPAAANRGETLVEIRAMPVGALEDSGEGYRSYQISFRTEPTSIQNIALFLQRLQQSPQALRVDSLELTRQPASTDVSASFRVTRTVIGDAASPQPVVASREETTPKENKNFVRNPGFEQWDGEKSLAPEWTAAGASLTSVNKDVTEGAAALKVSATGPDAHFYQVQHLQAGKTYDLQFDAIASGDILLEVVPDTGGAALEGASTLEQGQTPHRYHFVFTAPGAAGSPIALRVPSLALKNQGASVQIDNVVLKEAEGT